MRRLANFIAVVLLSVYGITANAVVISVSLGNTASGLSNGDLPNVPELAAIQVGQPAPFDSGKGSELFDHFDESWSYAYGIVGPILSASISFGIADHDTNASGSQLANFDYDGTTLTATLDGLFEADSSLDTAYFEYTLALADFAQLIDGAVEFSLSLGGNGLQTALFGGGGVSETGFNGAHLIFATLTIETEDVDVPVPEPSTLYLLGIGLVALGWRRRRAGLTC